jgi:hypothetical protein
MVGGRTYDLGRDALMFSPAMQRTPQLASTRAFGNEAWMPQILRATALTCAMLCIWILQHPYAGLFHDSIFYLIQALARLKPELYSNDIYLRYGSQDSFTVFSPLFSLAIQHLGMERAAWALTLVANVAFFVATAILARALMPARIAWLGIAVVCAVHLFYGGAHIFSLVETFVTPRLFAEGLVIAALTAYLKKRFWLAAFFGGAGLVLHPLMAVGGAVVAMFISTTPPRFRLWAIVLGALAACGLLGWMSAHGNQVRLDDAWAHLLENTLKYLWVTKWSLLGWSPIFAPVVTLTIGALALEPADAQSLCRAALIAAIGGIALNFVGGDLLRIALVVQSQPYRWLWVSTLIASLLLPLIVHRLWSQEPIGRATALLLVSAWLCMAESYGISIAALALLTLATMKCRVVLSHRANQLILFGAAAVLAIAMIYHAATAVLYTVIEDYSEAPPLVREIRALSRTGALPFALFMAVWLAAYRFTSWIPRAAVVAICAAALAMLAPIAFHGWTRDRHSRDFAAFAGWRALIPPRIEVLWFDQPLSTWILLQRPNYLSNDQEVSAVFSRPAAMAMRARVTLLKPYLATVPSAAWVAETEEEKKAALDRANDPVPLSSLCASAPDLRFIVTTKNMLAEPLADTPRDASPPFRGYKLYRCAPPAGDESRRS